MTQTFRRKWEEAELTDFEGRLDQPLAAPSIWRRESGVWLREGRLDFWLYRPPRRIRRRPPSRDLLTDFVRLVAAPDEKIRNFAELWGPLWLCEEHDVPWPHSLPDGVPCPNTRISWPPPSPPDKYVGWSESIAGWRKWAASARDLLNLAAMTHLGQIDSDWFSGRGRSEQEPTLHRQRQALARAANDWIEFGNPHIWVNVKEDRFWITVGGGNLFSALATQLAFTIARTRGFALCAACGEPFKPRRRPNASSSSYCPKCGKKAAWRDAQQRRRTKVKAQELYRELKTVKGVAERMNTDEATVNRFLSELKRDRKRPSQRRPLRRRSRSHVGNVG